MVIAPLKYNNTNSKNLKLSWIEEKRLYTRNLYGTRAKQGNNSYKIKDTMFYRMVKYFTVYTNWLKSEIVHKNPILHKTVKYFTTFLNWTNSEVIYKSPISHWMVKYFTTYWNMKYKYAYKIFQTSNISPDLR